jgi:hypothetical protein
MAATQQYTKEAHAFYKEGLELLDQSGVSYLLGGGFAMFQYTGIYRETKDLDIFCKPSDYPKILKHFAENGYETELTDVRWLAKVFKGESYIDIIFDTVNNCCRVDDTWFEHARKARVVGVDVLLVPPEELIWCKCYVHNRERYDGADINHIILKQGKELDWKRLLDRIDQHWHLLLSHIILFQFVYPSDYREILPQWLFDELMSRAHEQYDLPSAVERVCRGPVIDNTQYMVDIKEWDYKSYTIKTV